MYVQNIINDLTTWKNGLKELSLSDLNPKETAIISVDMIKGFCNFGRLSSPNYNNVSKKIARLFRTAHAQGFDNLILVQDFHDENSTEFKTFPIHCFKDSAEAQTIDEIKNLKFFDEFYIFYKNSLSVGYNEKFNEYLNKRPNLKNFIVVGVCTDLCIYNMVSHLILSANEKNIERRVVVPYDLVATYDAPIHEANFVQNFFLYHANCAFGAEVCSSIL